MSVQISDLKYFKSLVVNDTGANGGGLGAVQVVDGVSANIFPVVPQALRISGHAGQWRKVFVKNNQSANEGLFNAAIYIENPTLAQDMVFLAAGTLTDTQSDLSSPRLYGCGWLSQSINAADTSIQVLVENGNVHIFQVGDTIRISNKATVNSDTGTEEYGVIASVSWNGDVATIGLQAGVSNAYSSTNQATRVASLLSLGTIQASVTSVTVTSSGGDYDHDNFPVLANNQGSINQTFTLTFTSSTAFTLVGNTLGSLGSGNISGVNCAPLNPATGTPYLTINAAGFSGVFQAGDTIVIPIVPSAKGFWLKRVIPAATPSLAANKFVIVVEGESE